MQSRAVTKTPHCPHGPCCPWTAAVEAAHNGVHEKFSMWVRTRAAQQPRSGAHRAPHVPGRWPNRPTRHVPPAAARLAAARWPVSKLEAEGRTGCLITGPASSWLVLLRPDGTRSDREVRLQVPGPNPCRALVTDLTPGRWRAERVGAAGTFDVEVTAEAGAAWLEAEAGAWTLRR